MWTERSACHGCRTRPGTQAELEFAGERIEQLFVFGGVVLERGTELVEVDAVKTEHRHLLHPLGRVEAERIAGAGCCAHVLA